MECHRGQVQGTMGARKYVTYKAWEMGRLPGGKDIYIPTEEGAVIRKSMCKGPEPRKSMFRLGN